MFLLQDCAPNHVITLVGWLKRVTVILLCYTNADLAELLTAKLQASLRVQK